jgi:small GTP-binding protein
MAGESESGE